MDISEIRYIQISDIQTNMSIFSFGYIGNGQIGNDVIRCIGIQICPFPICPFSDKPPFLPNPFYYSTDFQANEIFTANFQNSNN
jgi:hypothetical protein